MPERYVERLRARLEGEPEIQAVTRLEAVYLGPAEVLVAADVRWPTGSAATEVAAALARIRADVGRELPVIARLYLHPCGTHRLTTLVGIDVQVVDLPVAAGAERREAEGHRRQDVGPVDPGLSEDDREALSRVPRELLDSWPTTLLAFLVAH